MDHAAACQRHRFPKPDRGLPALAFFHVGENKPNRVEVAVTTMQLALALEDTPASGLSAMQGRGLWPVH